MTNLDITSAYVGSTQVVYMYMGDEIVWPSTPPTPTPYDEQYLTFEVVSAGTIGWKAGTAATPATIYYSINDGEWTSLTSSTAGTSFNVNVGDKVRFKGNNSTYCGGVSASSYMNSFQGTTASVNVYGNIMSLTDGDNFVSAKTFSSPYVFRSFLSFANLLDAENLILPATALTEGCYMGMLAGTSITTAPVLPATTLAKNCYWNMFLNTTSLVNAPDILPATTMQEGCYNAMFYGTRLTKAPELPATTLAKSCYYNMFQNCYTLEEAPELPAATLADSCYTAMFRSCSALTYIKCLATDISSTNCLTNWVNGVASAGTFVKAYGMSSWTIGNNGIPTGWVTEDDLGPYAKEYLTFDIISAGTISWTSTNTAYTKTIQYSKDSGNTWTSITSYPTGTSFNVSAGDKVMFKGTNSTYTDSNNSWTNNFKNSTSIFNIQGNIMSLLYGDNFKENKTLSNINVFAFIFEGTYVVNASNLILPATAVTQSAYNGMFYDCTRLLLPPILPATSLEKESYIRMFSGCTSLTQAPALPATTMKQYCYAFMFQGCESITQAPALPSESLADYCYTYMFANCTNLTQAPALPATSLKKYCYSNMFKGCTSLTQAPVLPAKNISSTAVTGCYVQMFKSCNNLNYIKCLATSVGASYYTDEWVDGVAASGTFVKATSMTGWPTGINGIPSGWTVQDDVLPYEEQYLTFEILSAGTINWAGKLGHSKTIQYSKDNGSTWTSITSTQAVTSFNVAAGDKVMFRGDNNTYCSSTTRYSTFSGSTAIFNAYGNIMSLINSTNFSGLTSFTGSYNFYHLFSNTNIVDARNLILPVKTLTDHCYAYMFKDCPKLIGITCLATNISANNCTYYWLDNVASAGTFVKAAGMTGWGTGTSGIPTNWTVQDA